MTDKEIRSLLVNSGFSSIICDFKEDKKLTWEEVYAIYCEYLSTVQFFAIDKSDKELC